MQNNDLKQFQAETVESVIKRFYEQNQKRVLVADEVGLGKTLIASGVLEEIEKREKHNKNFKVVYICSNQSIAKQNMQKLNDSENNYSAERLTMQSFNIAKQNNKKGMQLIGITPSTSFELGRSTGTKRERALIYVILTNFNEIKELSDREKNTLERIFTADGKKGFKWDVEEIKKELENIEEKEQYIEKMHRELLNSGKIKYILKELEKENLQREEEKRIIKTFRIEFAKISIKDLGEDTKLVIIDEFQRYKNLIQKNEEKTETELLIDKFFNMKDLKILMLSATPFKLYATKEEIKDSQENYYEEFLNVMKFLFNYENNSSNKSYNQFKQAWEKHTKSLLLLNSEKGALPIKENAENEMYRVISRTERKTRLIKPIESRIKETEYDIESFFQINDIRNTLIASNIKADFDIDYIKSSPYLLSYNNYQIQRKIEEYYRGNKERIKELKNKKWFKNQLLWIDENKIDQYEYDDENPITKTNSKSDYMRKIIFDDNETNIDKLLWIPPTINYYNFEYPYNAKNIKNITKTLIFSRWEIVPKMVSTMMSYEMERKTIGEAYKEGKKNKRNGEFNKELKYFQKNSYIYTSQRLVFKADHDTQKNMNTMLLLYPSKTLSEQFKPVQTLNDYQKLQIKKDNKSLRNNIKKKLEKCIKKIKRDDSQPTDNRWYYLFPLILDGEEYVNQWFYNIREVAKQISRNDEDTSGFIKHIDKLKKIYDEKNFTLGKLPDNFEEILIDYIIGAPTNCIYRNTKSIELATKIGYNFINLFNMQQAMAILDLCYGSNTDYWKRVLKYCYSGNLQSVIDEYFYMLEDLNCLNNRENKNEELLNLVNDAMNIKRTTGCKIDTFDTFQERMLKYKENNNNKKTLRTHYAVSFTQDDSEENINRKESIRNAFNSPFWPFVLTTTSIGQEGLDFHYYCNRIVHWNLPLNPIDLEQREGRINRFKCLAIRKYVAKKFKLKKYDKNIWKEIFENAEKIKQKEGGLIPFWCLPNIEELGIERIIPLFDFSKDIKKYDRITKILALYRLTLGKENQEEILQQLYKDNEIDENKKKELEKLFINLSPYYRKKERKPY